VTAFLSVLAILAFAVWLTRELVPLFRDKWVRESESRNRQIDTDTRYAAVAERDIALREKQSEKPNAREALPPDLEARINSWDDEWAREDERKVLDQLYAELGNWDAVRRKYRPPLADASSDLRMAQ
jgi:hypothetical protein